MRTSVEHLHGRKNFRIVQWPILMLLIFPIALLHAVAENEGDNSPGLDERFRNFELLDISPGNALASLRNGEFTIMAFGAQYHLDVRPVPGSTNVTYKCLDCSQGTPGHQASPLLAAFSGIVRGHAESHAFVAVTPDGIAGDVSLASQTLAFEALRLQLQPGAAANVVVLYDLQDVIAQPYSHWATTIPGAQNGTSSGSSSSGATVQTVAVNPYYMADSHVVQKASWHSIVYEAIVRQQNELIRQFGWVFSESVVIQYCAEASCDQAFGMHDDSSPCNYMGTLRNNMLAFISTSSYNRVSAFSAGNFGSDTGSRWSMGCGETPGRWAMSRIEGPYGRVYTQRAVASIALEETAHNFGGNHSPTSSYCPPSGGTNGDASCFHHNHGTSYYSCDTLTGTAAEGDVYEHFGICLGSLQFHGSTHTHYSALWPGESESRQWDFSSVNHANMASEYPTWDSRPY